MSKFNQVFGDWFGFVGTTIISIAVAAFVIAAFWQAA